MKHLIFDGDMTLFQACLVTEEAIEWEEGFFTWHCDLNLAIKAFDDFIKEQTLTALSHANYKTSAKRKITITFSDIDNENFRKKILPDYKMNRVNKKKPMCFRALRQYALDNYDCCIFPTLEGDDVAGILASEDKDAIVISGDKDFRTIPSYFYDISRSEWSDNRDLETADYWHLFQTLVGDTADNYKGCPGIGAVNAERLLTTKGASWETVVDAFEAKKLTEEDALAQAQVAFILRADNYNKDTGEIKLWTPHR